MDEANIFLDRAGMTGFYLEFLPTSRFVFTHFAQQRVLHDDDQADRPCAHRASPPCGARRPRRQGTHEVRAQAAFLVVGAEVAKEEKARTLRRTLGMRKAAALDGRKLRTDEGGWSVFFKQVAFFPN